MAKLNLFDLYDVASRINPLLHRKIDDSGLGFQADTEMIVNGGLDIPGEPKNFLTGRGPVVDNDQCVPV